MKRDVRALSFETAFENVTPGGICCATCYMDLLCYMRRQRFVCSLTCSRPCFCRALLQKRRHHQGASVIISHNVVPSSYYSMRRQRFVGSPHCPTSCLQKSPFYVGRCCKRDVIINDEWAPTIAQVLFAKGPFVCRALLQKI